MAMAGVGVTDFYELGTGKVLSGLVRRIAKEAHPDVGGSHEQFVRISQARDALLECIS
jgi:malonyl CoA-acyl carrier protein transacylase